MLILFDLPESEPTLCARVRCFFVMDIVYTSLIAVSSTNFDARTFWLYQVENRGFEVKNHPN